MALPNALKNFNVFNEGKSFMGVVDTVKLPKLSRKMEAFRGGGMDGEAEIDLGQEKLEIEQELGGFSVDCYKQYGVTKANGVMLRFAGAYQRDDTGDVQAVEIIVRGRHKEIDPGDAKNGSPGKTTVKSALTYYKLTVDGKEVIEIDVLAFIYKVDGKDMLEAQRKAIGLA
jgi:P2 family phage contractile tail tube protein